MPDLLSNLQVGKGLTGDVRAADKIDLAKQVRTFASLPFSSARLFAKALSKTACARSKQNQQLAPA